MLFLMLLLIRFIYYIYLLTLFAAHLTIGLLWVAYNSKLGKQNDKKMQT